MLNCGVSSTSISNQINSGVLGFFGLPEPNGMVGTKSVYRTDPHQTAPNQKKIILFQLTGKHFSFDFDFYFNFSILSLNIEEINL